MLDSGLVRPVPRFIPVMDIRIVWWGEIVMFLEISIVEFNENHAPLRCSTLVVWLFPPLDDSCPLCLHVMLPQQSFPGRSKRLKPRGEFLPSTSCHPLGDVPLKPVDIKINNQYAKTFDQNNGEHTVHVRTRRNATEPPPIDVMSPVPLSPIRIASRALEPLSLAFGICLTPVKSRRRRWRFTCLSEEPRGLQVS